MQDRDILAETERRREDEREGREKSISQVTVKLRGRQRDAEEIWKKRKKSNGLMFVRRISQQCSLLKTL